MAATAKYIVHSINLCTYLVKINKQTLNKEIYL